MDISGLDLEPLAKHLPQTNLTRLELYSVTIANLPHLMVSLCCSTVNVLELVHADLGDADALIIAKSLTKTKLTVLTLNRNRIGTKGAIDLSRSLKHSSLQYLGLGENPIGTEGCKAIIQAIVQSSIKQYDLEKTNSTEIDFNCLKIENLVDAQITSISIDCYNSKVFDAVCQNIKHVQNDFRLRIRDFQLALIFKEAQCSNVKSLSIDASYTNNGNSLLGIESYLGVSNIQRICITEAKILPAFLGNLLSNLSNHSPLQYLEITGRATSANTQQGMIDFAKHLPNTNLKHLVLNKLDFSDFSLQQLSKSISQTRLRTLDLSGNRFSRNGIVQFVNTVKYSSIYKLSFIQQSSSADIKMIRNSFVDMLGDRRGLQVVL
ncbi:hypothetical protein HDV04_003878 [Boothiomyces sp. JEL0838]|nr:hypothetical protein HDV04_003878 [Boothiomyces sp. JEL0838]